jgi:hypothetical protein
MTAVLNKIPSWGWAIITIILSVLLAIHVLINPIVFGRMICPERALESCGKIRVVTAESGHEFYSESVGDRGFFVVPIINRLKKNHAVHLFLIEKIGEKETEVPLGGPIYISFGDVISQSEVELTVEGYDITKVEYAGGNIFTLVTALFESSTKTAMNALNGTVASLRDTVWISQAHAGDITDLNGYLKVQKNVKAAKKNAKRPLTRGVLIGESAPQATGSAMDGTILAATRQAELAAKEDKMPLSENSALRAQVERTTGFSIPDNHWQDIETPQGLNNYLKARAALAQKHPDLFAPGSNLSWGEASSKADGLYKEKYIFVPEATINSLQ